VTVLVLSEMFPNPGNAMSGLFVLQQMRALRRLGVEFTVVSPTPWIPGLVRSLARVQKYLATPSGGTVDGFPVEYPRVPMAPGGKLLYLSGLVYYLGCRRQVRALIKKNRIDLIHAHAILPIGFAAVLLGREFNLPVTCTVHGSDINVQPWRNRGNLLATKWALTHLDHVAAVSGALQDKVREIAGDRPLDLVPNGAEPELFRALPKIQARAQLSLPLGPKILLFVGRLSSIKNVGLLFAAMTRLSRQDTVLCLVGDGELRSSLEQRAVELGIRERCIFAGCQPHQQIPLWMSAADGLVISSHMEGFPTILPEAMLCRIPIVATAVGGIPEAVVNRVTGLLVPPNDALELARAVDELLDHSEATAAMLDRAEAFARENLTWEANACRTLRVYKDLRDASQQRQEPSLKPAQSCGACRPLDS
jgi:glycosyltransferase involved in cell wall biosynthesis